MQYGLALQWLATYLALSLLALPTGFAVVWLVGYWVGHLAFGWPAVLAAVGALSLLSGVALARGVEVQVRGYLEAAVVFTLAFSLLVAIRAFDPGVYAGGGEKFLDYGLLRSLLRSPVLPPEDVWFANEPVQYYYGGHLLAAMLTIATDTAPRYAYNLALAGFYAALVTAAYGVAGAVAARRGVSRYGAGAFAAILVGLASNLVTPVRTLGWFLPDAMGIELVGLFGLDPKWITSGVGDFGYWNPSRVIAGTINEFPLFAFLNGDLHAHMMSTPFLLLLAAVCFAYWTTPEANLWRRRALIFGAIPPLAGILAVVNTWSFPSAGGVTMLALLFAPADPRTLVPGSHRAGSVVRSVADRARPVPDWLAREASRIGWSLAGGAAVVLGGVVLTLPFFLGTASGRSVALLPAPRSGLGSLLMVHGAFLGVTALYLARRVDVPTKHRDRALVCLGLLVLLSIPVRVAAVALFAPVLLVGWALLRRRANVGFETVLALAAVGLILIVEFAYVKENAGPSRMNTVFKTYMQVWVLWATAAGVMLADVGRVRRTAAAARADLGTLLGGLGGTRATDGGERVRGNAVGGGLARLRERSTLVTRRVVPTVLALALVASLLLYGGFAIAGHFHSAPSAANPTLDATAYIEDQHGSEWGAIQWLESREGQPTIVSAPTTGAYMYYWTGDDYRQAVDPDRVSGANAPSSLTGVPTVAGWYHEVGYRGRAPYFERVEDVETIFTGDDAAQRRLLDQYEVRYVYVGPAERNRYDGITVTDLPEVVPVHQSGSVTVYRVES